MVRTQSFAKQIAVQYRDMVWDGKPIGGHRAASASRLDDAKWKAIFHAVVEKLGWSADGCDVEEGNGGCSSCVL